MAKSSFSRGKGTKKKVTSIGHSNFTRYNSKNDKKNKKPYRGQGC